MVKRSNEVKKKRLIFVLIGLVGIGLAATLITISLRSNLTYFYTPTQIAAGEAPVGQLFRVGRWLKK